MNIVLHRLTVLLTALCLLLWPAACPAEGETTNETGTVEDGGYLEIEELLGVSGIGDLEGLNLEDVTAALENEALAEYYHSESGFFMLYPALFRFDENAAEAVALSEDGSARLEISNERRDGKLTEDQLTEAFRLEHPTFTLNKNEMNGCLRLDCDGPAEDQAEVDLYLMTESWLHHVRMIFPKSRQESFLLYVDFMVNSMTAEETDAG